MHARRVHRSELPIGRVRTSDLARKSGASGFGPELPGSPGSFGSFCTRGVRCLVSPFRVNRIDSPCYTSEAGRDTPVS